ncbi:FAD-dependent oxidoreductase [Aliikangiella sp. IMCC44632]
MKNKKITLVGAGLVGSLTAVFLAKRGYQVEIFERRPDMRKTDISAGRSINLALANRGIHPLKQAGLMPQVEAMLIPMKGRMIHDISGNLNFQPYGQRPEEEIYSISRADLNSLCMDAAESFGNVSIHFNQKCTQVNLAENTIELTDEQSGEINQHSFQHLIGTDGSASAVRHAIHNQLDGINSIEPLGHSYKELTIPAAATGDFQIDKNALHIWPRGGFMIIALPNLDGSFTVTLFMPNEGEVSFASINTPAKLNQFFSDYFPNLLPLLPSLQNDFFNNPTGSLSTVKCSPWHYKDKALLLGDAAHAIVPFHGQGMNCGFEDVYQLDQLIAQSAHDWESVFSQTEKLRKPNADAIATMAIENYITMRDSVNDAQFILKSKIAFELEKRFPDYFCPRYSMVMFHRLPYAEAYQRGIIQNKILAQLSENLTKIEQVDWQRAEQLVTEQLAKLNLNPAAI